MRGLSEALIGIYACIPRTACTAQVGGARVSGEPYELGLNIHNYCVSLNPYLRHPHLEQQYATVSHNDCS